MIEAGGTFGKYVNSLNHLMSILTDNFHFKDLMEIMEPL